MIIGGGLLFIIIQTTRAKNTGFETKTLWDWMELLIIPLVLAIGAFFLNRSERTIERKTAEDRAKLEREIATDRQQEAALQAYLDRMAELLLKDKLRTTKNKEVRNVARIRTLTVLRGLDGKRKGMVVLFLYESGLLSEKPIIDLAGAELERAYLEKAKLSGANLSQTILTHAFLDDANLSGADLSKASMAFADLTGANLNGAKLNKTLLNRSELQGANLKRADLREVQLIGADLRGADLSETQLIGAVLFGTDLRGADLNEADLTDADLRRIEVAPEYQISPEQLKTVKTLKGAIMPDGTKHD